LHLHRRRRTRGRALHRDAGATLPGVADELAQALGRRDAYDQRGGRAAPAAAARASIHRARAPQGPRRAMRDEVRNPKVSVVMPAYNAGRTLRMTYEELPKDTVSMVILVDDGSTDATLEVARQLGLEIFVHNRNYGYGANQKPCYTEALRAGADVVVMVHPDYQYDPTLVPQIIAPIIAGDADLVIVARRQCGSPFAH